MPGYNVTSGAEAFSNAIDTQLQQQATAKRQAMLDTLAAKKEADNAKYREQEIELRHQEMEQKLEAARNTEKSKGQTDFEKRLERKLPGDIVSNDFVTEGAKYGYKPEDLIRVGTGTPAVAGMPGQEAAPVALPGAQDLSGAPAEAPALQTPAIPAQAPQAAMPGVYVGNVKARQAEIDRGRQQKFIDSLDDTDPRKQELQMAFQAEQTGLKVPPGYFSKSGAAGDTAPVMRQNATSGKVERLVDGQWTTWSGDVPKGAHWMTEPPPKDTSARDAASDRHLDQVHQQAIVELNKRALPFESHVQSINDLGIMLNARTPQADALIAPLVLKATVSGAGTGFRMTQSEINQVIGGRSKWESLQAALNKWNTDPSKALSITDDQRTQLRDLAKKIREKATSMTRKVTDTRHQLDDAKTPQEIHKLMTSLQDDLGKLDTEPEEASGGSGTTIEYDMNGKPLPRKP